MNSLVSAEQSISGDLTFSAGASRLSIEDQQALERAVYDLERTSSGDPAEFASWAAGECHRIIAAREHRGNRE